jgi:hypothetical protein
VSLLVHIVLREPVHDDTPQFEQHTNRQAGGGDDLRALRLRLGHPGRHRQRRAIHSPHNIVDLIVDVV